MFSTSEGTTIFICSKLVTSKEELEWGFCHCCEHTKLCILNAYTLGAFHFDEEFFGQILAAVHPRGKFDVPHNFRRPLQRVV